MNETLISRCQTFAVTKCCGFVEVITQQLLKGLLEVSKLLMRSVGGDLFIY